MNYIKEVLFCCIFLKKNIYFIRLICALLRNSYFYHMEILGKLIIIGGAVDKGSFTETNLDKDALKNLNFFETGILKRIIQESKYKEESRIEVITTASKIPREIGPEYVKAFSYLGANNADVLYIEKREQANDPEVLERLQAAEVVMFTGGDQLRLT